MAIQAAKIRIIADRVDDFLAAGDELAAATRAESACGFYEIYRDKKEPTTFYFIEEWTRDDAMAEHFETPHCKKFGALMAEIADGEVEPFEWERVV
jgi:quinol monooxygenase YgiN